MNKNNKLYKSILEINKDRYIFKVMHDDEVVKKYELSTSAFDEFIRDKRIDVAGEDTLKYLDGLVKEREHMESVEEQDEKSMVKLKNVFGDGQADCLSEAQGDEKEEAGLSENVVVEQNAIKDEDDAPAAGKGTQINDEIARAWLSLTHRKEYSVNEYNKFKLGNEIADMEKYLKNKADILNDKIIYIDSKKIKDTYVEEEKWSAHEHSLFIEYFMLFNKKFHVIAKLLNRNTKDVILHYYHTKKKERYNKKKNGRLSDSNLKVMIDLEWTDSERNKFERLYDFYGKNWKAYEGSFMGKNVSDFKSYYRYLSKNKDEEKEGRTSCSKNVDDSRESVAVCDRDADDNKQGQIFDQEIGCADQCEDKKGVYKEAKDTANKIKPKTAARRGRKRGTAAKRKPSYNTVKKPKVEKENNVNTRQNVLEEWTIDERQLFAIFYPYIGKNWNDLSQYITTKKPSDCRTYFKFYFKNLSLAEQKLEAAMRSIERNTLSVPSSPRRLNDDDIIDDVGIIFKK